MRFVFKAWAPTL